MQERNYDASCDNCLYYDKDDELSESTGYCCRHAPQIVSNDAAIDFHDGKWPVVQCCCVCGEHSNFFQDAAP